MQNSSFADITVKRLFLWVSLTSLVALVLSFILGFLTQYPSYILLFTVLMLGYTFLCHMWSESITLSYSTFGFKVKAFYFVSLSLSIIISICWILFQEATVLQLEQAIVTIAIAFVCHIQKFSSVVGEYANIQYSSRKPDLLRTFKAIIIDAFKESIHSVLSSTVFLILSSLTMGRVLMTLNAIPRFLEIFPTHLPLHSVLVMMVTYVIAVLLYAVILLYLLLVSQKTLASVLLFPLNFSKLSTPAGAPIESAQEEYFFSALTFFCTNRVPECWKPPAIPVDKFESVYFSEVTLATSHSRNPTWSKILDHHIASMNQVENQVSPCTIGPPLHPFFMIRLGPQYLGWLYKLQALRDLFTVSGEQSSSRRKRLLQNENSWSLLLHSVCIFLGTLSIQVCVYIRLI